MELLTNDLILLPVSESDIEDMRYDMVSGGCAKDNRASFRVMEKAGMCHNEIYEDGGFGFYMEKKMFWKMKQ